VEYFLEISDHQSKLNINFNDKEPSRGAAMAGLRQAQNITLAAYDIDENGKRWDKQL
jgi:hypothetical protein